MTYIQEYSIFITEKAINRFINKIEFGYSWSSCWIWKASKHARGYGQFFLAYRVRKAHRVAYLFAFGHFPSENLVIDHLCKNTSCVNPLHIEAVTQLENIKRGDFANLHKSKTHCPSGHPYSGENLYTHKDGRRVCKTCNRIRIAEMRKSGYPG